MLLRAVLKLEKGRVGWGGGAAAHPLFLFLRTLGITVLITFVGMLSGDNQPGVVHAGYGFVAGICPGRPRTAGSFFTLHVMECLSAWLGLPPSKRSSC